MAGKNKAKFGKGGVEEILPSDQALLERSKTWHLIFKKYSQAADGIVYNPDTLPEEWGNSCIDDSSDDEESVSPDNFEKDVTDSESDFDLNEVANQTVDIIQNRKENWKSTGIDKLLESFTSFKYIPKVEKWLSNHKEFLQNSDTSSDQNRDINMVMRKNTFENVSDSDSLESVDTAKYILTNRKYVTKIKTITTVERIKQKRRYGTNLNLKNSDMNEEKNSVKKAHESLISAELGARRKCTKMSPVRLYKKTSVSTKRMKKISPTKFIDITSSSDSISSCSESRLRNVENEVNNRNGKENDPSTSEIEKLSSSSSKNYGRASLQKYQKETINAMTPLELYIPIKKLKDFNKKTVKFTSSVKKQKKNRKSSPKLDDSVKRLEIVNSTAINPQDSLSSQKQRFAKACEVGDTSTKKISQLSIGWKEPILLYSEISCPNVLPDQLQKTVNDVIGEELAAQVLDLKELNGSALNEVSELKYYPPESDDNEESDEEFLFPPTYKTGAIVATMKETPRK